MARKLPANLNILEKSLIGENGLIGTNGLTGETGKVVAYDTVAVGPQPLPPSLNSNIQIINPITQPEYTIKKHQTSTDANGQPIYAELSRHITLTDHYYEQYWYNHTYTDTTHYLPIYTLVISPTYTVTSKAYGTFWNPRIQKTFNYPILFIPLKEKDLYKNLWDETENAKFTFNPHIDTWTDPLAVNINGFTGV
jgi:hypothetical protein